MMDKLIDVGYHFMISSSVLFFYVLIHLVVACIFTEVINYIYCKIAKKPYEAETHWFIIYFVKFVFIIPLMIYWNFKYTRWH